MCGHSLHDGGENRGGSYGLRRQDMAKAIGLSGIFFKSRDPGGT